MLGTIDEDLHIPHHSTAAKALRNDEPNLATYLDEALCLNLSITEKDNHAPLAHVTTAIVLDPEREDFDTLRADIAAIYHAKMGNGKPNERVGPDQLPMLTIQHGISARKPQVLDSTNLTLVLDHARVAAQYYGVTNAISAMMPGGTVKEKGVDTMKPLPATPEVG